MATAIRAHDRGGKPLLIEKTQLYGGSSAMSGGSLWIPNNHLMAAAGVDDSPEEALTYLRTLTRGEVPEQKLARYVETAPRMLRYMADRAGLLMQSMLTYTDYYPETPGGKPGGRSVEPHHFDLQRGADSQHHVGLHQAPEALDLGGHAIGSGHQAGHEVHAVTARDGFANRTAVLVRHDDRDAGQDRLLGIGDASSNRRSALLRGGRGGDEQSSDEQREHASHEALRSLRTA